jgi:hypothetical protein
MKKNRIIFLVFFVLLSYSFSFAQRATTEEEYNYMTKGYKTQVEQGLDMKKNYEVVDAKSFHSKVGNYEFDFIYLLRSDDKSFAGWIVKAVSTIWDNTYWYCIPVKNKDLFNKSYSEISTLDFTMTMAFFEAYYFLSLSNFPVGTNYTTEVEYNYMNKGFKTQIEQGLDMKKGYVLDEKSKKYYNLDNYEFELTPLIREADKSRAGIIVATKSSSSSNLVYWGIPYDPIIYAKKFFSELPKTDNRPFVAAFFGAYVAFTMQYESSSK